MKRYALSQKLSHEDYFLTSTAQQVIGVIMKKPRMFYWEEVCDAWCPVPAIVDGELIVSEDQLEDGDELNVRFKRVDMTDEEFNALPEG